MKSTITFTVNLTNRYERVRIIGDIHGCYTALQQAITPWDEKNTLYLLWRLFGARY